MVDGGRRAARKWPAGTATDGIWAGLGSAHLDSDMPTITLVPPKAPFRMLEGDWNAGSLTVPFRLLYLALNSREYLESSRRDELWSGLQILTSLNAVTDSSWETSDVSNSCTSRGTVSSLPCCCIMGCLSARFGLHTQSFRLARR